VTKTKRSWLKLKNYVWIYNFKDLIKVLLVIWLASRWKIFHWWGFHQKKATYYSIQNTLQILWKN